jgi:serine/threonine-protein kinase SRPK3
MLFDLFCFVFTLLYYIFLLCFYKYALQHFHHCCSSLPSNLLRKHAVLIREMWYCFVAFVASSSVFTPSLLPLPLPSNSDQCMVFEVLGENLLSLIKKYNYRGVPIHLVKIIALQSLVALEFCHDKCAIIHTDIKPENTFLMRPVPFSLERVQKTRKAEVKRQEMKRLEKQKQALADKKLNKNQRKRLKAKLAKLAAAAEAAAGDDAASSDGDDEKHDPNMMVPLISKLGDLGNGCWVNKHFTDDVTTRQYRAPEVIVGAEYSTPIDVWSVACMIFELITGEYLFDPKEDPSTDYPRDEDHLALMLELNGESMPDHFVSDGKFSKEYFTKKGQLRHIKKLSIWPIENVLHEKYGLEKKEAVEISKFLSPMLRFHPAQRASAGDALKSPWLADLYEAWKKNPNTAFHVPLEMIDPSLCVEPSEDEEDDSEYADSEEFSHDEEDFDDDFGDDDDDNEDENDDDGDDNNDNGDADLLTDSEADDDAGDDNHETF